MEGGGRQMLHSHPLKKKFSNAWPVSGVSPITERLSLLYTILLHLQLTATVSSLSLAVWVAAGRTVTCHDARRTPYQETNRSKKATTFIPLIRFDFPQHKKISLKKHNSI
jgi:hypothetical protein